MSYPPETYEGQRLRVGVDFLKRTTSQKNGVGTANATAGIDDTDGTEYRGRAVRWNTANDMTMQLCGEDEQIDGVIDNLSSGKLSVILRGLVNVRNGQAASLARGKRVVGDTRVIASGGTAQLGYVKTVDEPTGAGNASLNNLQEAVRAKGTVIAGGATPTANAEAEPDVVIAFNF